MPFIFRIRFRNGVVRERRGTEEMLTALWDADFEDLIDYVMGVEIATGEVAFYTLKEDQRFDGEEVLTCKSVSLS